MGGYVINLDESEICAINRVSTALRELEDHLRTTYPALYEDLGTLFTGEIQVVLDGPPWAKHQERKPRMEVKL